MVSNNLKNKSFKNIKLKTVYVEIERLKWSNVMKKRFWKKHRLLRPCVSRICRQLLNIELQQRKNHSKKSLSKEQNDSLGNKENVENTENRTTHKKQGLLEDDFLTKGPPKKKLKFSNGDCSDSESESLKEKPPDTINKNLENVESHQKIEDAQVNGNDGIVPATKSNSAKPSETNLLTLYTKSGVKVLSMKSVTVTKPKVSNISSLQKGIRREQSLVKSSSVEPLSNNCDINKKDKIENPCYAELDNKLEGIIENKEPVEIAKENILNEDTDDIDSIKNNKTLKIETKPLEQSQLNDLKNQESEIDSCKESVSETDKKESSKGFDIDRIESDKKSLTEVDKGQTEESVNKAERNETDVKSSSEADRDETDEESVSAIDRNDFDKASISEDNRIDDDDDNTQGNGTSDTESSTENDTTDSESSPEIDPSFDPLKFLDCAIKTDDDDDPENQNKNKKVPFMKSQNFQLNCDTMVMIKPLLPGSMTPEFSFKYRINYMNAFRITKELTMMTFKGQYGSKNHYVHLPEDNASNLNQEDNEDSRTLPIVDPFTHSVFAPIIKRDRLKEKRAKTGLLRKFRSCHPKTNPPFGSQLNLPMSKISTDANSYEKQFRIPSNSSENPVYIYQPNMGNLPPNSVVVNSNTIKIGNHFFSRVYADNKPTQMFRPMNTSENIVHAPQHRISRITMCTPNVTSLNNVPINSGRYIYTASPSTGMPLLIPVVQSHTPNNNNIPVLTSIQNSQYSRILPVGNTVSPDSSISNISNPHYMNFGDSIAPTPVPHIPLNAYNQTGPGLINDTNSSMYPPILNGNFHNSEVIPSTLSSTNPQCNTVGNNNNNNNSNNNNNNNNNNSNSVPPPLSFSVPGLINQSTPTAATDISNLSQQHNQMTSMTLSDKFSSLENNCNEHLRNSVIVNRHPGNPSLPSSSHSSGAATLQTDEIHMRRCENSLFFQWLHDMKSIGSRCGSGCSYGSNTVFFNIRVKYVQMFISNGFPNNFSSVMNAVYQLLIAENVCSFHAEIIMNDPEYLENLRTLCNLSSERESNRKCFGLPLPYIPPWISNPATVSSYNMFILKRFVFVVEKETRTVLYPLPAACKFQDNEVFDKITVLVLMSPKFGLGPGLIIFPRSILGRDILLSLGLTGPLFETWTISAHQKGGLTQSMMTEFLNGQCRSWILRRKINQDTYLAVDWWWNLEDPLVDNLYTTFNYFSLHKMFPLGKDPFDISISFYLERLWGSIVKTWRDKNQQKLQEHHFPQFIYEVFNKLCDTNRLTYWCRESGLYPFCQNIKDGFPARVYNMCE